jgi:uncharacterized protein YllA (UPF0747 family)
MSAIVTGQQIGLLGGPLYTAYKVLGAAKLARQKSLPAIFWLETNDADFNEINHFSFLDKQQQLQTLTWKKDSQGYSSGYIETDRELTDLIEQMFAVLQPTSHTAALRQFFIDLYQPGRLLAECARILSAHWFSRFGVEVFDPQNPDFRQFSRTILLREAENTPMDQQCHLFCLIGKRREALFRREQGYFLRSGEKVELEKLELLPNVKTRNICQDAYFDTDSYVAGPGERSYIADLDEGYLFHQVKKPQIVSRMSITLIEPRVARFLRKQSLTAAEIINTTAADASNRILQQASGLDVKSIAANADEFTDRYLNQLSGLNLNAKKIARVLKPAVKEETGRLRAELKQLQQKQLAELQAAYQSVLPFNQPQERVFNLLYFMNLYGGETFLDWLYDHYDQKINTLEIKHD